MRTWWLLAMMACAPEEAAQDCTVGLRVGDCPPDVTLPSTDGESLTVSEWTGHRLLFVGSSTWCRSCRTFVTALDELVGGDDAAMVMNVLVQDNAGSAPDLDDAQAWRDGLELDLTVLADVDHAWTDAWTAADGGATNPHSYTVVGADGRVVWHREDRPPVTVEELVEQLLP
jgi:peroxiredoxin